jgi:hypothetical protein
MRWKFNWRKWIVPLTFWVLFAGSIALDEHYHWVQFIWMFCGFALVVLFSINALTQFVRHRHHEHPSAMAYSQYPRWIAKYVLGEDDLEAQSDAKTHTP